MYLVLSYQPPLDDETGLYGAQDALEFPQGYGEVETDGVTSPIASAFSKQHKKGHSSGRFVSTSGGSTGGSRDTKEPSFC